MGLRYKCLQIIRIRLQTEIENTEKISSWGYKKFCIGSKQNDKRFAKQHSGSSGRVHSLISALHSQNHQHRKPQVTALKPSIDRSTNSQVFSAFMFKL